MRIEDAIKRYEFWAEDDRIDVLIRKEHRQVADWLKELKADRPQGKWFINDAGDAQCPICGEVENAFIYGTEDWYGRGESHFCPNCGARMKGATDGNK